MFRTAIGEDHSLSFADASQAFLDQDVRFQCLVAEDLRTMGIARLDRISSCPS